jgi:hypothetical protein
MKTAQFKITSGKITGKIINGYAHGGSYNFILWDKDRKTVIKEKEGDFLPGDPCSIELPLPNQDNNGRILECISTITIIPPLKDFNVSLEVQQDGKQFGEKDTHQGTSTSSSVDSDLFIKLIAG